MEETTEKLGHTPDGLETLALSLQMAVKTAFELSDETCIELKSIESRTEERQTYEMWLNRLRLNHESGLKNIIASAFCVGDVMIAEDAREIAQWHAKNRFIANIARSAIQEYMTADIRRKRGSNSTMNQRQINGLTRT